MDVWVCEQVRGHRDPKLLHTLNFLTSEQFNHPLEKLNRPGGVMVLYWYCNYADNVKQYTVKLLRFSKTVALGDIMGFTSHDDINPCLI